MKVHKRDIASQYEVASNKLRRLPHVFARVLELPIHSDADVSVKETSGSFCFTAAATTTEDTNITSDVRAHTIEIFPDMTKIVIRGTDGGDFSFLDKLEHDLWRFRLPASTRPEMATARCCRGELVVTVPKGVESENNGIDDEEEEGWLEANAKLVLVL